MYPIREMRPKMRRGMLNRLVKQKHKEAEEQEGITKSVKAGIEKNK